MKTHYELLDIAHSADAETIKKAFRREIARYHPDKVIHLGLEFQEMAAVRAAELTVAYKTLTDDMLRAEYDLRIAEDGPVPVSGPVPPVPPAQATEPAVTSAPPAPAAARNSQGADTRPMMPPVNTRQFETERAGRDAILLRAMIGRVQAAVVDLHGAVQTPPARGFDLVMVPTKGPRFLGTPPPRVLVKVMEVVDATAVNEGWSNAARARVHVPKSPLIVLLLARRIAPQTELARALEVLARQPKAADAPSEISVLVVDVADWSARVPPGASAAVRALADRLRN